MGVSCRPSTSHCRLRWTRAAGSAGSRFRGTDAISKRTRVKPQGGAAPQRYACDRARPTPMDRGCSGPSYWPAPRAADGEDPRLTTSVPARSAACFGGHRRWQTAAFALSGVGTDPARVPGSDAFTAGARALTFVGSTRFRNRSCRQRSLSVLPPGCNVSVGRLSRRRDISGKAPGRRLR